MRRATLMLDLDTATALGLVVVELISNSYRHAFPEETGGLISVVLHRPKPGGRARIVFADTGVGFSDPGGDKRRGIGLIRRLIEQIEGPAEVKSDRGTTWTLTFPVAELV
jgi:two-component sensor histidine kinase